MADETGHLSEDIPNSELMCDDLEIRLDSDSDMDAPSSSAEPESAAGTSAPKRTRTFKGRSKPSEKCGKCKHCLNPHWKQRCLEAKQGDARAVENPSNNGDSFVAMLGHILRSDGGVDGVDKLPRLLRLFESATEWGHRRALLKVLHNSGADLHKAFIANKGLIKVEAWLDKAISEGRSKFVADALSALALLPITLAALRKPSELGRMVGKLRKSDFEESIRSQARILIAKWKALADVKPASSTPAQHKPIAASAATQNASESKNKVEPQKKTKSTQQGLGEADIFGSKQEKKPSNQSNAAQRVRVVASNAAKSQIAGSKRSTSVARVSASPLDSLSDQGYQQPARSQSQSPAKSYTPLLAPANTALAANLASLTASERAKLAADSVPEEPKRQKRKASGKKLRWAPEEELTAVRLFLKHQPPCKVSADPNDDDDGAPQEDKRDIASDVGHESFERAAKQQHHSEAQALKDFKAQEEEERKVVEERLRTMKPGTEWRDPPMIPQDIFEECGTAASGEESTERVARKKQWEGVPQVTYSSIQQAPPCPAEPPVGASMPLQPLHLVPKIPLSVEEARMLASARTVTAKKPPVVPMNGRLPAQSTVPARPPMTMQGLHPPKQQPQMPVGQPIVQQRPHRPMASQKLQPMLGLHGANKTQQSQPMPAATQQRAPRPMLNNIQSTQNVCAYFNRPQGCIHGDKCRFAHVRVPDTNGAVKRPPNPQGEEGPRKMVKQV
ncbi:hypothetical protein M9435_002354 [Picochlorum sp. BPE23]|nr:hypothetical protein M9435_002354 [Picochlorum sp. BPE23]